MTLNTVNSCIENFAGLIKDHATQITTSSSLDDMLKRMQSTVSIGAVGPVAAAVIRQYIKAELSKSFPILDQKLFELRRWLKLEIRDGREGEEAVLIDDAAVRPDDFEADAVRVNGTAQRISKTAPQIRWFEAPLLLELREFELSDSFVDEPMHASLGFFRYQKRRGSSGNVQLTAEFPGRLGVDQYRQQEKAMAILHTIYAEVYRSAAAAEIWRTQGALQLTPAFFAYWIPPISAMKCKHVPVPAPSTRDPAFVMKFDDTSYLLSLWDAPNELPIEGHLREFSTGPWQGIKADGKKNRK